MSTPHDTRNPSRRRRGGLLLPKPKGALAKLHEVPVLHREAGAAAYICRILADSDLLDVETLDDFGCRVRWLLVPVSPAELDYLAAFGSEREDLENGHDREPGDDDEPDHEDGDDSVNEPNVVSPTDMRMPVTSAAERMTVRQWHEGDPPVYEAEER